MKNIVLVIALVLFSSAGFGQKVNFSGNWKFNSDKSEQGDQFSLAPKSLIMTHTKKTLEMERINTWDGQDYTSNDVFTLDGEVCENPGMMNSVKKSTATFDKKTSKLTITTDITLDDGTEVEIEEILQMDGQNLVVESTASSAMGDLYERFLFDRE